MEGNKKESIFKKIENNVLLQVVVFVVSMAVIVGGYVIAHLNMHEKFEVIEDNFLWVYQVDSISIVEDDLILEGWAFELGKDAIEDSYEIVLFDIESEKVYYPEMKYKERKDANQYFLCEYDYTKSGFVATISATKLDLEHSTYEVLVYPKESAQAYATGVFYANGKMLFGHPETGVSSDVEGTLLEEVVENGVLRVYRPDVGMYVYQYDAELYWIADEKFKFEEDGTTNIQYILDTTQVSKLPQSRLDLQKEWDNLTFVFETNEVVNAGSNMYRVAKEILPMDYSVTRIQIGYYADGWGWMEYFYPYYDFIK